MPGLLDHWRIYGLLYPSHQANLVPNTTQIYRCFNPQTLNVSSILTKNWTELGCPWSNSGLLQDVQHTQAATVATAQRKRRPPPQQQQHLPTSIDYLVGYYIIITNITIIDLCPTGTIPCQESMSTAKPSDTTNRFAVLRGVLRGCVSRVVVAWFNHFGLFIDPGICESM